MSRAKYVMAFPRNERDGRWNSCGRSGTTFASKNAMSRVSRLVSFDTGLSASRCDRRPPAEKRSKNENGKHQSLPDANPKNRHTLLTMISATLEVIIVITVLANFGDGEDHVLDVLLGEATGDGALLLPLVDDLHFEQHICQLGDEAQPPHC